VQLAIDIDESATLNVKFMDLKSGARTLFPRSAAATGYPSSPTFIQCLSSMLTIVQYCLTLMAYSLMYLYVAAA